MLFPPGSWTVQGGYTDYVAVPGGGSTNVTVTFPVTLQSSASVMCLSAPVTVGTATGNVNSIISWDYTHANIGMLNLAGAQVGARAAWLVFGTNLIS